MPVSLPSSPPSELKWLRISSLRAEQIAEVVALDQACLGGLWSADGYQRELDSPNSELLILEKVKRLEKQERPEKPIINSSRSAELIGLACLWAILEEGHITLLGIAPAWQRQGLGQLLLWRLLSLARQRGLEWATLEVRASNQAALSLYGKLGFRVVGERKRYYPDDENAQILWKKGLQTETCERELEQLHQACCDRLKRFHWQLLTEGCDLNRGPER